MEDILKRMASVRGTPSILVVEDDIDYVRLLQRWFEGMNYELVFCLSGEEAISQLSTRKWNLVWLDLKLPGISGVQVLDNIKDIPVLVVTSYPNSDLASEAMKRGGVLIMRKPETTEELKKFIKQFNLHG